MVSIVSSEIQATKSTTLPEGSGLALKLAGSSMGTAAFCRARYLAQSPINCHLPFIFWLIALIQPRVFTEIGLSSGSSYFAACQAMGRSLHDVSCFGVRRIDGTKDAQRKDMASLLKHNKAHYADFSSIYETDLATAHRKVRNQPIDILLVDDVLDGDAVEDFHHDWLRKLSNCGILLIHGAKTALSDEAGRSLLNRLCAEHPFISMNDGSGMVAILYGEQRNPALLHIANVSQETVETSELLQAFRRLGQGQTFEVDALSARRKAATLDARIKELEAQLEDAQTLGTEQVATTEMLAEALDARNSAMARVRTEIFDLRMDAERLSRDLLRADAALKEQAGLNKHFVRVLEGQSSKVSDLNLELHDLRERTKSSSLRLEEERWEHDVILSGVRGELDLARSSVKEVEASKLLLLAELDLMFQRLSSVAVNLENERRANGVLKSDLQTRFHELSQLTHMLQQADSDQTSAQKEFLLKLANTEAALASSEEAKSIALADLSRITKTSEGTAARLKEEQRKNALLQESIQARYCELARLTEEFEKARAVGITRPSQGGKQPGGSKKVRYSSVSAPTSLGAERRLEAWIVSALTKSEKKLLKYRRDRKAFFRDSNSKLAKMYFGLTTR